MTNANQTEISNERKNETRNVKTALINAGFTNVSVGHGRGTAWGWLDARATSTLDYAAADSKMREVVLSASGRTGRRAENISLTLYVPRLVAVEESANTLIWRIAPAKARVTDSRDYEDCHSDADPGL